MSSIHEPGPEPGSSAGPESGTDGCKRIRFDDNGLLPLLYGEHDQNLARLEQLLGVSLVSRGNQISITGAAAAVVAGEQALNALHERIRKGLPVGDAEVDAAARLASSGTATADKAALIHDDSLTIRTRKRHVSPRSPGQAAYLKALERHELVFGIGPAGTGKTYLAVAKAVSCLMAGEADRLILSRPAVEAGERLGFLPGDLRDKIDPYLRPLYDALFEMMPAEQVARRLTSGEIEVAPLAFMRGRTLSNAYIILDEAQNSTTVQMKMFLTRLGENSRMAVTGDLSQVDLPSGQKSGLREAVDLLAGLGGVACVQFTDVDVVRPSLVTRIVRAYEARDRATGENHVDLFSKATDGG